MVDRGFVEFFFPYFVYKESKKFFSIFLRKYLNHPRNRKNIYKSRLASISVAGFINLYFKKAKGFSLRKRFRMALAFFFFGRDQRLVGDLGLKKRSSVCFSNFFLIPKKEFGLFLGIKKKFVFRSLGYAKPSISEIIFKDYFKNNLGDKYSFGFKNLFFSNVYFYKNRSSFHGLDFSVSFYNGLCSKFSLLKINEFLIIKDFNFGSFVSINKNLKIYRNCLKRFSGRAKRLNLIKFKFNYELFFSKILYKRRIYANCFIQLDELLIKFKNNFINNYMKIKLLFKLIILFSYKIIVDFIPKIIIFFFVLIFFGNVLNFFFRLFLLSNKNKNAIDISCLGIYRNQVLINVVSKIFIKKVLIFKKPNLYMGKVFVTGVKVKDFYYVFGYFLTMLYQKHVFDTTSLKNNLFFIYKYFGIIKYLYINYFKDIFGLRNTFFKSKFVSVFFKLITMVSDFNGLMRLVRSKNKFYRIWKKSLKASKKV